MAEVEVFFISFFLLLSLESSDQVFATLPNSLFMYENAIVSVRSNPLI